MTIATAKTGTIPEISSNSSRVRHVAIPVGSMPAAVRWSFLFFVFTFPFEGSVFDFLPGSIATLSGLLFFAIYFLYYGIFLGHRLLPRWSPAVRWFLGYGAIYTLHGVFEPVEFGGQFVSSLLVLARLLLFFWIASDLLKDDRLARSALVTYCAALVFLATGLLFRVPGFYQLWADGRVTGLGDNPNTFGLHAALGVVILIGFWLQTHYRHFSTKISVLLLTLPLLVALV